MAKFVDTGESIECNQSEIEVRKISPKPIYVDLEDVGKFYKYKSNIRCLVSILEVIEKPFYCKESNINQDDSLEAPVIEIYTEKKLKFKLVSNASHVHSIQKGTIKARTYASITMPFEHLLNGQKFIKTAAIQKLLK